MTLLSKIGEAYDALTSPEPVGLGLQASGALTWPLSSPAPWLYEAFGGRPSASGKIVTPETSMRVAAVYACVSVLSQSVGQLPLILYKRSAGGADPADQHPLYQRLLNLPNPEMTSQDVLEMGMNHLCLRGRAFHQVVRSEGQVVEINPLNPDWVRMFRTPGGALAYSFMQPGGPIREFGVEQCWRVIGMTHNGVEGVSPLTYARESIGLAMATEEHGAKLFTNGAQLSVTMEVPDVLSDTAYKRLKDSFKDKYSGSANAWTPLILEEGMKANKLSMTNVDSQFIEARRFQLEEICRIYRVPPHKIQEMSRATFNNIEHLTMDFVNSSLVPWLRRYELTINRDLLLPSERKKYFARFDVDSLQRGDMQARANYYASGIANTWLCPDEARAGEGRNKRPDGKGGVFENPNTSTGKEKPGAPVPDTEKG